MGTQTEALHSGYTLPQLDARAELLQQAISFVDDEARSLGRFSTTHQRMPAPLASAASSIADPIAASMASGVPGALHASSAPYGRRVGDGTLAQRLAPPRPSVQPPAATWRSAWPVMQP